MFWLRKVAFARVVLAAVGVLGLWFWAGPDAGHWAAAQPPAAGAPTAEPGNRDREIENQKARTELVEAPKELNAPVPWHEGPSGARIVNDDRVANADNSPVDASKVAEIRLLPPEQSGWMIRFFPDGSAHAQYGPGLGDAAKVPKGSVDFGSLLKAAYRLKSDQRLERLSTISVSFKEETNTAFSVKDDTLFRYLIDSFDKKWQPELGGTRFDALRRKHPIYKEPANPDEEKSKASGMKK